MRFKRSVIILIIFTGALLSVLALNTNKNEDKIDGVSLVAPPNPIDEFALASVSQINAGWVAVIPYAFSQPGAPEVNFDYEHQWWGEKPEGTVKTIKMAKDLGLKIMLKPHVWVRGQGWAGDFELNSEADWLKWEENYRAYIMAFAKIADSLQVDMFCIGTEFRNPAKNRPEFWVSMIKEIRSFYDGKITYAANWDNYQHIAFWNELDYIGIDAYFPLSASKTPTLEEIKVGWTAPLEAIASFQAAYNKPVLFTEFGFQSIDYTAAGHWNYAQDTLAVNLQAQAQAYDATFGALWSKPWFAGGFLWKWHAWHDRYGGVNCKRYTPQNKPAQEVIAKWYK